MMQCQYCGDTQGPWVSTSNHGLLCEDCNDFFDAVDRTAKVIKKRYEKKHDVIDTVTYMDVFENKVYEAVGLK